MDTSVSRIVMWGSAFAITLVSGVVLSNLGKPLNSLIFTIHKLIAIGTVILLSVNIYNLYKAGGIGALHIATFASAGLFFVALIVSGALLSLVYGALLNLEKPVVQAILRIHQIAPLLALAASTISMYLLVSSNS